MIQPPPYHRYHSSDPALTSAIAAATSRAGDGRVAQPFGLRPRKSLRCRNGGATPPLNGGQQVRARGSAPYGARKRPRRVNPRDNVGNRPCLSHVASGPAPRSALRRAGLGWLGESPPRRSHRLSPGGESRPPGAPWSSTASPDRRPAPSTRGARPETRPADLESGGRHRHA